ncbi:unnamed protein product [Arctogadus glacialis]
MEGAPAVTLKQQVEAIIRDGALRHDEPTLAHLFLGPLVDPSLRRAGPRTAPARGSELEAMTIASRVLPPPPCLNGPFPVELIFSQVQCSASAWRRWAFVMKKHLSTTMLGRHGIGQRKESDSPRDESAA